MPTRIAPLLVVVILLAGLRSADAQPAQPRLSTAAQAAARYLLTDSELPQGFRRSTPLREVTNEDLVGANGGADLAPLVVSHAA